MLQALGFGLGFGIFVFLEVEPGGLGFGVSAVMKRPEQLERKSVKSLLGPYAVVQSTTICTLLPSSAAVIYSTPEHVLSVGFAQGSRGVFRAWLEQLLSHRASRNGCVLVCMLVICFSSFVCWCYMRCLGFEFTAPAGFSSHAHSKRHRVSWFWACAGSFG